MAYRKPDNTTPRALLSEALGALRRRHPLSGMAVGVGALTPLMALGSPTGGQVAAGSATITNTGSNRTIIDQSSQRAIINWQQFSVGANQYVQFVQPNSSSVVLNRVIGGNISNIFGDITANGQVFLINPNGILFGRGATLDMSGLVASTFSISDQNFMQGDYAFTKAPNAPEGMIISQGDITAARGGYVVLAGDYVENDGRIQAQSGRVYLAAGNGATLTLDNNQLISYTVNGATLAQLAGVVNAGDIVATGGAVYMTGDVANALTATAVNNQGFISAKSIKNQSGTIVLAAEGGELLNSGTLDANAASHGANLPGGTIVLRGNQETELTRTSLIDAAGAGAGGYIELSGRSLGVRGEAITGKGGNLVLDPNVINITSGSAAGGVTNGTNSVGVGFIASKLTAGSNVTLIATNTIENLAGANRTITATAGTALLTMQIGAPLSIPCATGICLGAGSFTQGNGSINLSGLTINIPGSVRIAPGTGTATVDNISATSRILILGSTIHIKGNLAAAGGSLTISGNTAPPNPSHITTVAGKTITGKRVSVSLFASYGGSVSVGAITATSYANVSITDFGTHASLADTIKTGAITAPQIDVSILGHHQSITTGPLTAINGAGSAAVKITESVPTTGTGAITVNGNITVSGKTRNGESPGQFDLPQPAEVELEIVGSGNVARSVKVNGAISVTAQAANYSHNSNNESGPTASQTGAGGMAGAYISATGSHGAASVTGDITAKGADAFVGVQAHSVTVQNVTVTGSGHRVSRVVTPRSGSSAKPYSSSNSAGLGIVALGEAGGPSTAASVKAGNITVSGKGVATAVLAANQVSAGNITVTAAAAKGKITQNGNTTLICSTGYCNSNSASFYRGIGHVALHLGSVDGGRGDIVITGGNAGGTGSGVQATSIKAGALSATGVGQAYIGLSGKTIQTQGLTAIATKGTLKGTGSSVSGANDSNHYAHTFDIDGGAADIKIRSGNSGSHSSGVLTQNGGPVTITGNVSATGPTAAVDFKANSIKISGTVSLAASGGSVTSDTVFTPGTGTGYHTHLVGADPTTLNLQGGASGSVSVAGKTTVKAPGLIGAIIIGGSVKLHGFSGSASAVKNYSLLDTRVSTTTQNLALGSIGLIVADVKAVGGKPAFTSASDVGDITLKAKGDVDMASRIKLSGNLNVQAAGSIFGSSDNLVTHFSAISNGRPRAGSHSGGGNPSPGELPQLSANANAIAMVAGKNITLTGAQLTVGTGTFTSIAGDPLLLTALAGEGLSPLSSSPNGAFEAGGTLSLGSIKMTGTYLLLQGTSVSILGPVSTPAGTLVQVAPADPTAAIDIENTPVSSAAVALVETNATTAATFNLSNQGFISLFPGDTVAVGDAQESGAVTIGANGIFDIGSTNLIIESTGAVTGLSTVTSTGLVVSLFSILGPPIPPVTSGEIDPTAAGTTPSKQNGLGIGGAGGGGIGGTIADDDNPSGVCH